MGLITKGSMISIGTYIKEALYMLKKDIECTKIRGYLGALVCQDCKYCVTKEGQERLICISIKDDGLSISGFDDVCENFECYTKLG